MVKPELLMTMICQSGVLSDNKNLNIREPSLVEPGKIWKDMELLIYCTLADLWSCGVLQPILR